MKSETHKKNCTVYRIVTCADSEFYHFLPTLEQNVRRKTGRFPIIYDIGLTEKQRNSLKSELVQITPQSTEKKPMRVTSRPPTSPPVCWNF